MTTRRVLPWVCFIVAAAQAQPLPQRLAAAAKGRDAAGAVFQVSTLDALSSGLYEASFTVGQMKKHGDFGVGTYEGLDGEMIVLDGHVYQMRANGVLSEASDDMKTPFAVITKFRPDVQFSVRQASYAQLSEIIDAMLPSKNFFYALRVRGPFTALTTRSVGKQFVPYMPLAQVLTMQTVFNYNNISGTAVGFRSPAFVSGINQAGYHFHFVSDDRKAGGHALGFITGDVTVEMQVLRRHSVWLPDDEPFMNATLPLPLP